MGFNPEILTIITGILAVSVLSLLFVRRKYQAFLLNQTEWKENTSHLIALQNQEIEHLKKQLQLTKEDALTQLPSWYLFSDRLQQHIKESQRHQFTMGLLMVDIDDFRLINNALGYECGDTLIREVAKRLQECIRTVDSVARFSKDTFAVLLAQLAKPETASLVAQRILNALKSPFKLMDQEIYVTVGIGIAIYPTDAKDEITLLRSAEHALQTAKKSGKHHYEFYQEPLSGKGQQELAFYSSLGNIGAFKNFIIYYQPIMNIQNETVLAMDAMLYWQPSDNQLIGQEEISLYAEKKGRLNEMTEWLLENACKQFMHWQSLGFNPTYLSISLQIEQLESSAFVYRLSQILQNLSFEPKSLLLSVKIKNGEFAFSQLEKSFNMLNYLGIKIAIDNFGLVNFPLSYLKNINIQFLKIAASLINDIDQNKKSARLISGVIYLATQLEMKVIMRGVENHQQLQKLRELGCELMQGHLLGDSISEFEVEDQLKTLVH